MPYFSVIGEDGLEAKASRFGGQFVPAFQGSKLRVNSYRTRPRCSTYFRRVARPKRERSAI